MTAGFQTDGRLPIDGLSQVGGDLIGVSGNFSPLDATASIVTVDTRNSQYYVDNRYGASRYGTTMDGLTVPFECRVPVTPGKQVTVEIAVADASDSIYDSAIALLDGGIYSE